MWLGALTCATHDMGDRPLPPSFNRSLTPHVGQAMMSKYRVIVGIKRPLATAAFFTIGIHDGETRPAE
jgi:hypothetical protein